MSHFETYIHFYSSFSSKAYQQFLGDQPFLLSSTHIHT